MQIHNNISAHQDLSNLVGTNSFKNFLLVHAHVIIQNKKILLLFLRNHNAIYALIQLSIFSNRLVENLNRNDPRITNTRPRS